MSAGAAARNGRSAPRRAPGLIDTQDQQLGYVMAKLEDHDRRFEETHDQIAAANRKLDALPDIIRAAMDPLAEKMARQGADIDALKLADVAEKSTIAGVTSIRTRIWTVIVGLVGACGTVAAVWEAFHPSK